MKMPAVKIPQGMMEEVEVIVNGIEYLGFESVEEFVREAIRVSIMKYRPVGG